jgi:hypothetical protein
MINKFGNDIIYHLSALKSAINRSVSILSGMTNLIQQLLCHSLVRQFFIASLFLTALGLSSCEKDIDIKLKNNTPLLVVEAYINNEMPQYNYVVLSRSLDYFSLDFQGIAVANATVTITEGQRLNDGYVWDTASKVRLIEANLPAVPANFRSGVYFDPRLVLDSANALKGTPRKSYLLEISEGGNQYSSIATLLQPVQLDSISSGYGYFDEDDGNKRKLRVTMHYKDPDTLNNTQLTYYRFSENRNRFGWGGFFRGRAPGFDDVTNGQYINFTNNRGFFEGDTVTFHLASVTRDVYNFWQSFNNARNNNGPFATPVTLNSNIIGNNVTGCFSGLSLSSKTIIMK